MKRLYVEQQLTAIAKHLARNHKTHMTTNDVTTSAFMAQITTTINVTMFLSQCSFNIITGIGIFTPA